MPAVFAEPRLRKAKDDPENPKEGYVLEITGSNSQLFQDWAQQQTDEQLWQYIKSITEGISERNLEHYHFKICNGRWNPRVGDYDQKWHIDIYYGEADHASLKEGPLQVSRCMSCDMDCPLLLGVLGEAAAAVPPPRPPPPPAAAAVVPAESASPSQPLHDASTDSEQAAACTTGSADAGITAAEPALEASADQQHPAAQQEAAAAVEAATAAKEGSSSADSMPQQQQQQQLGPVSRDSLVKETEHCRVWWDAKARPMWIVTPKQHVERLGDLPEPEAVDLIRTAVGVVKEMGCRGFESMILNHGDSRNHAHLHLKVRVFWKEFARVRSQLPPCLKEQLAALELFRDQLPLEARGTRQAWQQRQQNRQQERNQRQRRW